MRRLWRANSVFLAFVTSTFGSGIPTRAATRSLDRRRQRLQARTTHAKREFPSRSSIRRINMEIPKRLTYERIASTQNLAGTLGPALSLSYTTEARGWREDRRVALASPAPHRSSSTFYSLAPASASDLPKGEIFRFPPLRRVVRSYVCATFLRIFGRFLRSNVSTGDRSCTPMALWLRAATTVGPY